MTFINSNDKMYTSARSWERKGRSMKKYVLTLTSGYKQVVYGLDIDEDHGNIYIMNQCHVISEDYFTIPSKIVEKVEVINNDACK